VEAEVFDSPPDLQRATSEGELKQEIKDQAEDVFAADAEITSSHATTQLNTEPSPGYRSSGGWGTVCRSNKHDKTIDSYGRAYVSAGVKSVLECSDECTRLGKLCQGFEYRRTEGRCEIHPAPICHTEAQNEEWFADTPEDFRCYMKKCP